MEALRFEDALQVVVCNDSAGGWISKVKCDLEKVVEAERKE